VFSPTFYFYPDSQLEREALLQENPDNPDNREISNFRHLVLYLKDQENRI